ncbi:MAG: NAD(P)H-dependent glycerol-3-phosphate dehydrogenase [Desulfatiglandales bacterium]
MEEIGVLGAGSWGTALSNLIASKGYKVHLWVREKEVYEGIRESQENKVFLPGIRLSQNILPSMDIEEVSKDKDLLLIAIPSHGFRDVLSPISKNISKHTRLLVATKGIENRSLMLMSQVASSLLGDEIMERYACIAGPSFAKEVVQSLPTVVTVASNNLTMAKGLQNLLHTHWFRVYVTDDVMGAQLAGALKNVIAIAAGMCDALGFGHNARAALITRGLVEITRLGLKLGAQPKTFAGLAGLGDLILTCTSDLSRNRTFGYKIGLGMSVKEITESTQMVAEGLRTTKSAFELSMMMGIEMPITEQVYKILYEGKPPMEAAKEVMTRSLKEE